MTDSKTKVSELPVQSPTPTVEDYLWMIFTLQRDGEDVIGARLAELLEVTPPTVTVTLKRMIRDGWIFLDESKRVHLTDEGSKAAKTVLRRHMLVEWLLSDLLNVPWSRLHDEAHQLEHYISDDVEARLVKQLGDPKACPHGNPIPGNEKHITGWVKLTEVPGKSKGIIRRVHEHAENRIKLMQFLEDNHILPGKQIVILENLPINQTISLQVGGKIVSLGHTIAQYIFVQLT